MANLIILHEDALRLDHPIFNDATKALADKGDWEKPIFIWDPDYFSEAGYSFKRLVFIYETLSAMPVDIYHGKMNDVLLQFIQEKHLTNLFFPETPNPQLRQFIDFASRQLPTHIIDDDDFVSLNRTPDLGRFFRYWNKAKKAALSYNGIRL